ncbi:MAG: DivIVA domain-containing protein [Oscillospiraceae bacterium]|nr:DivIVA domain-containing protein [Oscillospiraceae bacterium]
MVAKEIMSKKFEMVLRGYKTEEVEEFLREISLDFSRLQKENEDLEKKLEVLADKIREYREDEDALKDALLGAQRQGNALIADSKRKAAIIIEEAQSKSAEIIKKAEDDRKALNEKGENEKKQAEEKAKKIIEKANKKAKEIEDEMNLKTDVQKEVLHRTTTEIEEFKQRVLNSYKRQMEEIEGISVKCENEFIRETNRNYKGVENSQYLKNADSSGSDTSDEIDDSDEVEANEDTEVVNNDYTTEIPELSAGDIKITEDTVRFEINVNDDFSNDETVEMNLSEIFKKSNEESFDDIEELPLFKDKKDNKKTSEIFFNKSKPGSTRSKQLRFGNNSDEDGE